MDLRGKEMQWEMEGEYDFMKVNKKYFEKMEGVVLVKFKLQQVIKSPYGSK